MRTWTEATKRIIDDHEFVDFVSDDGYTLVAKGWYHFDLLNKDGLIRTVIRRTGRGWFHDDFKENYGSGFYTPTKAADAWLDAQGVIAPLITNPWYSETMAARRHRDTVRGRFPTYTGDAGEVCGWCGESVFTHDLIHCPKKPTPFVMGRRE